MLAREIRWRKSVAMVIMLTLILTLLVALPAPVSAATITVCASGCDYTTIQAAVNAAQPGDVIHVYPGTYNEAVDLNGMDPEGDITLITVNSSGVATPGTATVHAGGPAAEIGGTAFDGDVTIDGFIVYSIGPGIGISVSGAENDHNLVIRNVTASGTGNSGIVAGADGNVTITDCVANNNTAGDGIWVGTTGGNVTITDCQANSNGGTGIVVKTVGGYVTLNNCTANGNGVGFNIEGVTGDVTISNCTFNDNKGNGGYPMGIGGDVSITSCLIQNNGSSGMWTDSMASADSFMVNGNIICGNGGGLGLSFDSAFTANAEGNWWGCAAGPGNPGCDTVSGSAIVDLDPWISSVSPSASVDPVAIGQPTIISFQFSDSARTMFLGQGPGDSNGTPPFTLTTDNGTLDGAGATVQRGINNANGVLSVTLVPATVGTATVTLSGPCGLGEVEGSSIEVRVTQEGGVAVPEASTIILFGSGLAGLAGYASLRLRAWKRRG